MIKIRFALKPKNHNFIIKKRNKQILGKFALQFITCTNFFFVFSVVPLIPETNFLKQKSICTYIADFSFVKMFM